MAFWEGFIGGFNESRDANIRREQELDVARRSAEAKVFEHLIASNDPEMRALAMTGLLEAAQPGKRSGFQGYLGKIQSGKVYPQVLARMNEMVPDEPAAPQPGGGPAPPRPGSAAMSSNAPVSPGSEPISMPMPPPPGQEELAGPPAPPTLGPQPGAPVVGGPPPVSKWKRRGTGVPTAEEIAEMNATAPIRARIKMVTEALTARGASPDVIQRAILGIAGAPMPSGQFEEVAYGVRLQKDGPIVPVALDRVTGQIVTTDGKPIPMGAEMVRLPSSTTAGAGLTSYIEDTPEQRQQLQAQYPDIQFPPGKSATGFLRLQVRNGVAMVIPSEFTPPPAYSGTTEILEPGTNIPVRAPINRGGGVGSPLGDAPGSVPAQTATDAVSLKEIVDRVVADTRMPGLPLNPARRDQVVQQEAQKLNLPYTTYAELVRATRSTPEVSPRTRETGGTMAERVRNRALQNRGGGAPTIEPPPPPPARSQSVGPRR